jgi:DNA polymerase-3 subunit delta'
VILTGNEPARAALAAAMASGALHHAWLIAGPEGVGKGRFARAAALRMLAEAAEPGALAPGFGVSDDSRTVHLVAAGSHPDYRELVRLPKDPDKPEEALARSITIGQVRTLQAMFATKPALSQRRVVLIDSIDDLERAGANALLKNLEEPPPRTVFLLVSHRPALLLPTVRSRCQLVPVRVDDPAAAHDWLATHAQCEDPELALALAGGAPLAAVSIAGDPVWSRRAAFLRALAARDADPVRIADVYRDLAPAQVLSWLQTWTFDLVQIRCCGRARYHRDMEPIAAEVAQLLDPIEATRLHRRLTALQRHVNHPLNARLFVEHMLFAYRQAFTRSAIPT